MQNRHLPPLVIILVLALAYGLTMAPGYSWANGGADGGDLIAAAAVNGVAHPTGYPLFLLAAGLFQALPLGSLAFRTNLMSAVCTIAAALLVYQTLALILKEGRFGRFAGAIAALLFGVSPLVWSQAVITEVYGLQSLLTTGILYTTVRAGNSPREDLLRGLLFGLTLGNHITAIFLLPCLLFEGESIRFSGRASVLRRVAGLLAGTTIYIVLPLRAAQQPAINWMDPVTLERFFQLVSGQIYQSYFTAKFALERVRALAGYLTDGFGIAGVVLGIFGMLDSGRQERFALLAGWVMLVYSVFAIFYASYDSNVYLIQTMLAFSLWTGIGIERVAGHSAQRWRTMAGALLSLVCVFVMAQAIQTFPKVDASQNERAETFGRAVVENAPRDAMVFTRDDQSTFTLWYFHHALGEREDMRVIVVGLLQYDWYRQTLRNTYPDLNVSETQGLTAMQMALENPAHPYCAADASEEAEFQCSLVD